MELANVRLGERLKPELGPDLNWPEDVVIRAEGLGKKYTIGHTAEREHYIALRDALVRGAIPRRP